LFFVGQEGFSVVAVMIASAKLDNVVEAFAEEANMAADQCSGTPPALVAMHVIDPIDREDLQTMLKTSNGLQATDADHYLVNLSGDMCISVA
jgi:hypothetical protein